jgi:CRISPR-associated endonuclease/helicase Cas3
MIDIFKLMAKTEPYASLCDHCEEVGRIAGILWDTGVINKSFISRHALCLLASLHDIGKCHPDFQKYGLGILPYADELMREGYLPVAEHPYRHEIGTEAILLKRHRSDFKDRNTAKAAAKILRLHHQKSSENYLSPSPKEQDWCEAQDALIFELERRFCMRLKEIEFIISDTVCVSLWGAIVLADWLASGGLEESADRMFGSIPFCGPDFQNMFSLYSLRPLQKQCEMLAEGFRKNVPAAVIIEAPMGEGKTEAALYLAARIMECAGKNGFYIALPTMATARQMECRTSEMLMRLGLPPALLVHSEAWLDRETRWGGEVDQSWFAPTKRALLSHYSVGTVDQAMMSVLRIKQGVLRLLGLSSKVLIIDEMHAYDTYMQTILYRLMNWCSALEIPVIILSATLPSERKGRIIEAFGGRHLNLSGSYPLITSIEKNGGLSEIPTEGTYICKTISLECVPYTDFRDVARRALSAVRTGGCACVIMNTVRDAQEVYAECKAAADTDVFLMLFHARFLAKDRKIIEDACLRRFGKTADDRPKKAVLVATQVVEQSLDIDFDYMISALAPIDLLLQRSGRIHRHNRMRPEAVAVPRFTVLINGETGLSDIGRIYEPWTLSKTQEVLSAINVINIPGDIRALIENVYGREPEMSEARFDLWIKKKSGEAVKEGAAKDVVFPAPDPHCFFPLESDGFFEETEDILSDSDAVTRLGDENIKIAVLPTELFNETHLEAPDAFFAKKVMEYSVSLSIRRGSSLQSAKGLCPCGGYLKGIWAIRADKTFELAFGNARSSWVKKYTVDPEFGIKEEE